MVKVQKPTPKTFAKTGQVEEAIKKKKTDKKQKSSKEINDGASVVAAPPVAESKKAKSKLIEKAVQEATLVKPVTKEKIKGKNVEKQEEQVKSTKQGKKKEQKQEPAPASAAAQETTKKTKQTQKKPLILAPPKSPTPAPASASNGKKNKKPKAANNETVVSPVAADAVATTKANKKASKKQKKTKAVVPAVTAGGLKKQKQQQPPLTKMQKKKATKRAFKKQQVKNKLAGKAAKPRKPVEFTLEPVPFDEDTLYAIVNQESVKKIAKALKTQVELEVTEKKTSIFSDFKYLLNLSSFKIPNCPKRMVKLNLKHSLVGKDDDVVIIVPDLQRGAKVEYEPTIQHYEDLFREAGVEGLKIMPFNQLRTECNTFEAVRKLSNTYDYFLCDGRLVGEVAGFCGKIFQKPRTTFHSVRLDSTKNIKVEIEKSLCRTAYKQLHKGDLTSIPVGNHNYTMQQLADNIEHVVSQLKTIFPGGLGNVRSMYLKIDIVGTSALPIYMSTAQVAPETPYVVGPREQRLLSMKKEANEVLSKFNMTKDGQLVKLNKTQVERKRKFKEARETLLADPVADLTPKPEVEVEKTAEAKPEAESEAETEVAVEVAPPKKKARKVATEEKPAAKNTQKKNKNKKLKKPAAAEESD